MAGGVVIVFAAGLADDLMPERTRGLVAQIRGALLGRVGTGVVKLLAAVGASLLVVLTTGPGGPVRAVLAVPVVAGSANVWNLLDVSPGRALKFFFPAAVVLGIAGRSGSFAPPAAAALGAAAAVFGFDLRERAMLGDAGANVFGFVVGVGLYATLSVPGLVGALVAILVLHVAAETVTLTRLIRAIPPLRWFDRAGLP
jgi:UDP-N-acetylmuramyl pentapeptide phosphotransferase/UDP-N-acetylglucosamine-1-phosphate transferase